eukprot:TRINITY_DN3702_c0_g1_i4.p1 TRINITY_DN3702_c0_g1~~TRINITY_DN3702_c0_g1_i4.p1  ORF type:complete len:361 (-),score=37.40 TRINITY_DN3702_c0_g1_i4:577-1629(-)
MKRKIPGKTIAKAELIKTFKSLKQQRKNHQEQNADLGTVDLQELPSQTAPQNVENRVKQQHLSQTLQESNSKSKKNLSINLQQESLNKQWSKLLDNDDYFESLAEEICQSIEGEEISGSKQHGNYIQNSEKQQQQNTSIYSLRDSDIQLEPEGKNGISNQVTDTTARLRDANTNELVWKPKIYVGDIQDTNKGIQKLVQERNKKVAKQVLAPPLNHKRMLKEARAKQADTKGKEWYDLPAPTITPELERDLKVVRLRENFDPKRFYKSFESDKLPKYFQIGTVIQGAADFYSGRLPKRLRRKTITEELLADPDLKEMRKKRFDQIVDEKKQWQASKKERKKAKKKAKSTV